MYEEEEEEEEEEMIPDETEYELTQADLDKAFDECNLNIEVMYFDPNKMDEYERIVAEADELIRQQKLASETANSPEPASMSPSPPSPVYITSEPPSDNNVLITERPRLAYALTKVPKAELPKDTPLVLLVSDDNTNNAGSLPDGKVQSLKRKLTEGDGSLETTFIEDSEGQAIKQANPIGFGCAWESCGFINKTEGLLRKKTFLSD